ncbi:transposase [Micromonospora saelicesensis]|uniref:transposase n=1 Tax=Micromonospora saelicesensis TaxID=285676 RepID=UPI000B840C3A|nr:transposase [Micromonospora saelicesensis]
MMSEVDVQGHHWTTGPQATARAHVTAALVAGLTALREQISALEEQIEIQLLQHPDAGVFTSLPHAGIVRAARVLGEIGDACGRFPTPEALTCLAGAAPSTRQSGKVKSSASAGPSTFNSVEQSSTSPATPRGLKRRSRTTGGREGCLSWRTSFHAAILRR